MSKEITRAAQSYVAKSSDESLQKDAGKALMVVSAGSLVFLGALTLIPFAVFAFLAVLAGILGVVLYAKS